MSEELVPQDVGSYLAKLQQGGDEQLADMAEEANPFDVMPRLVLSKDTAEIRAVQNDETVKTFTSRNPLYLVLILPAEGRALWRPDSMKDGDTEYKFPVCSTQRCRIGTFRRDNDRGVGTWKTADNLDLPTEPGEYFHASDFEEGEQIDDLTTNCHECHWNQFGSVGDWDSDRSGGKGKACSEGRLIIGYVCTEVGRIDGGLSIFEFEADSPMVYMNVPATSIAAVRGMGNVCVARNVPPRYTVFSLTCNPKKNGNIQWGELAQEFAGYVSERLLPTCNDEYEAMARLVYTEQVTPAEESASPEQSAKDDAAEDNSEEPPF
tara:strand:+ start:3931 stop:4893 length:963 start_codon:yes stop_codon:yes gene_type:complete